MANIRERQGAVDRSQHEQNGRESSDRGRRLIDEIHDPWTSERLAAALEHVADVAIAQHRRSRSFTSTFTGSITAAGPLFPGQLHLPEESAIAGAYVENNSTSVTLTVYEGSGSSGRIIGIIAPNHSKRFSLADHVSSISINASAADATPALVFVVLSTKRFSPTYNVLT